MAGKQLKYLKLWFRSDPIKDAFKHSLVSLDLIYVHYETTVEDEASVIIRDKGPPGW